MSKNTCIKTERISNDENENEIAEQLREQLKEK